LSTAEEQYSFLADDAWASIPVVFDNLITVLWSRRLWLVVIIGVGSLLAIGYALSLPNQYTSKAQLMPPDQQALSSASELAALTGAGSLGGVSVSTRTPGAIFIGILSSQSAQNDIIDRFDLRRVYGCKLYTDARKSLNGNTEINENRSSGIISISVTDRDPNRAHDLAGAYVEELDKLVNKGSTSSARREREFLEQRLESIKSDLDASSIALSQFSSRHATINPQIQGQALISSATGLQGELITAQSDLSGLKAMYSDDNVRVRGARARIAELQSQLQKMGDEGGKGDGADQKYDQFYPSIRELPILGVTYSDLSRKLAMQEGLYETLNKQYELAKVQEAKEIPLVKVLDEPDVPERKSSPHRAIIVIVGFSLSAFTGITWILALALWTLTNSPHPVKEGGTVLPRSIENHDAVTPR